MLENKQRGSRAGQGRVACARSRPAAHTGAAPQRPAPDQARDRGSRHTTQRQGCVTQACGDVLVYQSSVRGHQAHDSLPHPRRRCWPARRSHVRMHVHVCHTFAGYWTPAIRFRPTTNFNRHHTASTDSSSEWLTPQRRRKYKLQPASYSLHRSLRCVAAKLSSPSSAQRLTGTAGGSRFVCVEQQAWQYDHPAHGARLRRVACSSTPSSCPARSCAALRPRWRGPTAPGTPRSAQRQGLPRLPARRPGAAPPLTAAGAPRSPARARRRARRRRPRTRRCRSRAPTR